MYVPRQFNESSIAALHELIRREPLGALVVSGPNGLEACHVPFILDSEPAPHGTLRCHVARVNPIWRALDEREVLAIFQGPESYVSPSWYPSKREHGKAVPTWNYIAVHAHGVPTVHHEGEWLRALVESLTDAHEAGRPDRWHVSDAPPDYIEKMLGAIVGIEIPIARFEGSWKLSQNRSSADRQGVVAGLEEGAASQLEMARAIQSARAADPER